MGYHNRGDIMKNNDVILISIPVYCRRCEGLTGTYVQEAKHRIIWSQHPTLSQCIAHLGDEIRELERQRLEDEMVNAVRD